MYHDWTRTNRDIVLHTHPTKFRWHQNPTFEELNKIGHCFFVLTYYYIITFWQLGVKIVQWILNIGLSYTFFLSSKLKDLTIFTYPELGPFFADFGLFFSRKYFSQRFYFRNNVILLTLKFHDVECRRQMWWRHN